MKKILLWIKAIRAPFFTATIVPVLVGTAIALYYGSFDPGLFLLTVIGVILLHTGTNLANDYFDHLSRDDWVNVNLTPFSGGSRMIQEDLIPPRKILAASFLSFGLAALVGLYLEYVTPGYWILLFGLIGALSGYFYTATPLKFGYRGFGEILVGLNFGPLVVIGAYYVQAQSFLHLSEVLWASFPVMLLITAVLYINEFPDYAADQSVGKRTLVVLLGKERAITLYFALIGLTYLSVLLGVVFKVFPWPVIIAMLTLPMAAKAVLVARRYYAETQRLLPANALTITTHLATGILLAGGYLLGKWIF